MKTTFRIFGLLIVSLVGFASLARAEITMEREAPDLKIPGLHIFAGVGLNMGTIKSDTDRTSLGLGSNFKTDVTLFLSETWAVESSASVKFNQVSGLYVWDTLLTLGVRASFDDPVFGAGANYWRAFVGAAPTVVFLDERARPDFNGASRLQFEGPVVGGGLGTYIRRSTGTTYFFEINGSAQYLQKREDIIMDGETPVVVSEFPVNDHSKIYSVTLNFGILLF